jgi:hypothetical protein
MHCTTRRRFALKKTALEYLDYAENEIQVRGQRWMGGNNPAPAIVIHFLPRNTTQHSGLSLSFSMFEENYENLVSSALFITHILLSYPTHSAAQTMTDLKVAPRVIQLYSHQNGPDVFYTVSFVYLVRKCNHTHIHTRDRSHALLTLSSLLNTPIIYGAIPRLPLVSILDPFHIFSLTL